ncbi:hypothetical protein [Litorivita pollutaquae]|uniref:hypothetical protein n=1 Tax=Litorivita pollutaquae TaxID=2200892 RepID=UPI0013A6183B|nr:hypothetical protein [Litorivita pollutaquae]
MSGDLAIIETISCTDKLGASETVVKYRDTYDGKANLDGSIPRIPDGVAKYALTNGQDVKKHGDTYIASDGRTLTPIK